MQQFVIGIVVASAVLVGGYAGFQYLQGNLFTQKVAIPEDLDVNEVDDQTSGTEDATDYPVLKHAYATEGTKTTTAPTQTSSAPAQTTETAKSLATHGGVNVHAIPLGDGKVSTSPKVGYVYACQTSFTGGGAFQDGPWIGSGTWDLTKKISVSGTVSWPNAVFSSVISGISRMLSGNGLPVGSTTGIFPIRSTEAAYQYDRNPNSIQSTTLSISLPANPTLVATPSCVPMGPIGYALNGVAIFNALDDGGRDAVAHEVQDTCAGHPQQQGQYHYHGPSDCIAHAKEKNALVGYALDGFGIYSRFDANGNEYANADLDQCHGITSEIEWNGKVISMYHYVLTEEYPYTIGCFRGTPVKVAPSGGQMQGGGAPQSSGGTHQGGPPQEAIDACSGKSSGASCSVGPGSGTCRTTPEGVFACVPQ